MLTCLLSDIIGIWFLSIVRFKPGYRKLKGVVIINNKLSEVALMNLVTLLYLPYSKTPETETANSGMVIALHSCLTKVLEL